MRTARNQEYAFSAAGRHTALDQSYTMVRRRVWRLSLLLLCAPLMALARDEAASWYVSPSLGGITPDKPWGGKGSAAVYGLDIGTGLTGG
jgi:hypothetical protein